LILFITKVISENFYRDTCSSNLDKLPNRLNNIFNFKVWENFSKAASLLFNNFTTSINQILS